MGLLGLWAVAGAMLLSALVFGWVAITAHPRATDLERKSRRHRDEDVIRQACAHLDEEYRELLKS